MSEKKRIFEMKHFVAGEISGMIGATICHPCDTIKTKIQMNRNTNTMISFVYNFVKSHGITGLYRGLQYPFWGMGMIKCVSFGTFGTVTNYFKSQRNHNNPVLSLHELGIAGCAAGISVAVVTTPMDRLKVWSQIHQTTPSDSIKMLYNRYGIYNGFCNGFHLCLMRSILQCGLYYPIYESSCRILSPNTIGNKSDTSNIVIFTSGATAGVSVWIVSYPIDVLKTKIQGSPPNYYKSIVECAKLTYQQGGFKLFYGGMIPTIYRAILLHSTSFLIYERVLSGLNRTNISFDVRNLLNAFNILGRYPETINQGLYQVGSH